jgi:hypothetical protein
MIAANGWLVVTAVNLEDGAASSETYKIEAVDNCTTPDGPLQRFSVKAADDLGDTRSYVITLHEVGQILPEVRPYRQLVQNLIAADEPCPGPTCKITMLGHLLASCPPELVDLVKELDPDHAEEA